MGIIYQYYTITMIRLLKIISTTVLLLSTHYFTAQELSSKAFKSGEHLTYQASYNISGVLTTFAEINMRVTTVKTKKNNYLHLKCTANTYKKWDDFFKIRDIYEAYVTPYNVKPVLYRRDAVENGTIRKEKYIFRGNTIKATYVRGHAPEVKVNFNIPANTRDIVSTIYYIRNLPLAGAKKGDSKDFNIVFDRKTKPITLTFLGTETINTIFGAKKCYKIAVSAQIKKIKKGTNFIYITADKNKIPVLIKFSIPVGNGQLKLTKAINLKH